MSERIVGSRFPVSIAVTAPCDVPARDASVRCDEPVSSRAERMSSPTPSDDGVDPVVSAAAAASSAASSAE